MAGVRHRGNPWSGSEQDPWSVSAFPCLQRDTWEQERCLGPVKCHLWQKLDHGPHLTKHPSQSTTGTAACWCANGIQFPAIIWLLKVVQCWSHMSNLSETWAFINSLDWTGGVKSNFFFHFVGFLFHSLLTHINELTQISVFRAITSSSVRLNHYCPSYSPKQVVCIYFWRESGWMHHTTANVLIYLFKNSCCFCIRWTTCTSVQI